MARTSFSEINQPRFYIPLLLALLPLSLFLLTLSPTINFGDSPELISSTYTLGIAHPPGYPLYSLTAKLFTYLPWGESVAWKVNFASAFFSAASIFFIAIIAASQRSAYAVTGATFSALFLAASPTLWSQSVISEVYTLNLFLFALLLYISFLWWKTDDKRWLFASFFIYGLGLANHHTLVAFIPLLVVFILVGRRNSLQKPVHIFFLGLFFFLGLSVYIYLPLRAMQSPPINWGDPQTLNRLIDVILRRQFPTIDTPFTLQTALVQTNYYAKTLIGEFTIFAVPFSIWGCIKMYRIGTALFLFLIALFIIHGLGTLFFLNPSTQFNYANVNVMMLPSYAIFALWAGWGITEAAVKLSSARWGRQGVLLLTVAFALLVAYKVSDSFCQNDESNNYFAIDYGSNMFTSMDKDSVIFVESDNALFPLWYLQLVEGKRPDVAVIDVDFLMLPWFKGQIKERYKNIDIKVEDLGKHASGSRKAVSMENMLDAFKIGQVETIMDDLPHTRPVYTSYELGPVYKRLKGMENIHVINEGLIYKLSGNYESPDVNKWDSFELRSILEYPLSRDPYTWALATAYTGSMQRRARQLFMKGKKDEAMKIIQKIKEIKSGVKGFLK